jgi:hypothetical protein
LGENYPHWNNQGVTKTALAHEEPEVKIITRRKEAQGHPLPVKTRLTGLFSLSLSLSLSLLVSQISHLSFLL